MSITCAYCGRSVDQGFVHSGGFFTGLDFCCEKCKCEYKMAHGDSPKEKSSKGIVGGIVSGLSSTNEEKAEKSRRETMTKQQLYDDIDYNSKLLEKISVLTFDGDVNATVNQINTLFSQSALVRRNNNQGSNHKLVLKAIADKIEFGVMKLQSLNEIQQAEFYKKRLRNFKIFKINADILTFVICFGLMGIVMIICFILQ